MGENIYEFMQKLDIEGMSCGVDAITVTGIGLNGSMTIAWVMNELSEVLSVEEKKPFRFQGAVGFWAGPIRYASKYNHLNKLEWSILMVTGGDAGKIWDFASKQADDGIKFTRLDVCVDIKLREKVLFLPRKLKDSYKGKYKVNLIESLTGDTVYFGDRASSPMYIRIYDKSSEYGEDLGNVWRFELEAKKELAQELAVNLAGRSPEEFAVDIVFGAMHKMSLPTPRHGDFPNVKMSKLTLVSSERKVNWLKTAVAPTVRHLVRVGKISEVFSALGLPEGGIYEQGELVFDTKEEKR